MDVRTGLPVVGIVGAGQLARMTHQASIALGLSLRVLAASRDDAAALVAADVTVGDHASYDTLLAFAEGCDVLTFDHEHVPGHLLRKLESSGHLVLPGPDALLHAQDKRVLRERLSALGFAVPRWSAVTTAEDIVAFAESRWPIVAKAVRGGYDGRGVWFMADAEQAADLVATGVDLIVEERVPLLRELSALVARSPYGQVAAWPIVETVQRDGICVEVLAPAPGLDDDRATAAQLLAIRIADALGVVGVLAVELFDTGGDLLVNELAMRPHNSGHWTIEGSRTSQFEQHLRAVLDYPLGPTTPTAPAIAMANVLGGPVGGTGIDERLHHLLALDPGVKVHLYGKGNRPGRKIGHVTALDEDMARARHRAARAAAALGKEIAGG
ncbi:MAG: 5-(carboxyamino)imidazole ribonucleotide synthase [Actinomycetota bacterium]|nr:5-(carboxyamino)imidazole ribonucleotide synthase [Actinomycetota bacterium]